MRVFENWNRFTVRVNDFQERVYDLRDKLARVDECLKQLETISYERHRLEEVLSTVQILIDEMQRKNLSNISVWMDLLDKRIEKIIINRLKSAIDVWLKSFIAAGTIEREDDKSLSNAGSGEFLDMFQTVHEITLSSQVAFLLELLLNYPLFYSICWCNTFLSSS